MGVNPVIAIFFGGDFMYKVGDYVIYNHDVCKIIGLNSFRGRDYYVLSSTIDSSLKINVPIDNCNVRGLISRNGIDELIKRIPSISVVDIDSKNVDVLYKSLINDGSYDGLISIIKTTYLANKDRLDNNKKLRDKDLYYFNLAEAYLYGEFSIVLGMSVDEVKDYVISEVSKLV